MIFGTILLDTNDNYVGLNGKLPARPQYDKKLLHTLVEKNTISHQGYELLPNSMKAIATLTHGEPTLPITIEEIDGLTDLLLVSRSYQPVVKGKRFRLDRFERIATSGRFEIYTRRKHDRRNSTQD